MAIVRECMELVGRVVRNVIHIRNVRYIRNVISTRIGRADVDSINNIHIHIDSDGITICVVSNHRNRASNMSMAKTRIL